MTNTESEKPWQVNPQFSMKQNRNKNSTDISNIKREITWRDDPQNPAKQSSYSSTLTTTSAITQQNSWSSTLATSSSGLLNPSLSFTNQVDASGIPIFRVKRLEGKGSLVSNQICSLHDDGDNMGGTTIKVVAFASDDSMMALGCSFEKVFLYHFTDEVGGDDIVDATARKSYEMKASLYYVSALSFSPDNKALAVGQKVGHSSSDAGKISIFHTETGKLIKDVNTEIYISTVCYSIDGMLGIGGRDGWVIFDPSDETYESDTSLLFNHNKEHVKSIAFSTDSTKFAVGSWEGGCELFDTNTKETLRSFECVENVCSLVFSPDNTMVAIGGDDGKSYTGKLAIHDVASGNLLHFIEYYHNSSLDAVIAFSKDGTKLVVGTSSSIIVYDTTSFEILWESICDSQIESIAFSNSSSHQIVVGTIRGARIYHAVFGANSFKRNGEVKSVKVSPNGNFLAIGSMDSTVLVIDVKTSKESAMIDFGSMVYCVAFSADSKLLVIGGRHSNIKVYKVGTNEEVHDFRGMYNRDRMISLTFANKGSQLASVGEDSYREVPDEVVVFTVDADTVKENYRIDSSSPQNYIYTARFSLNDKHLIVGMRKMFDIYDASNGILQNQLSAFDFNRYRTIISPNGEELLTGTSKGELIVHNTENYKELKRIPHHESAAINTLQFTPDQRFVAVGGEDNKISFYNVEGWKKTVSITLPSFANSISFWPTNTAKYDIYTLAIGFGDFACVVEVDASKNGDVTPSNILLLFDSDVILEFTKQENKTALRRTNSGKTLIATAAEERRDQVVTSLVKRYPEQALVSTTINESSNVLKFLFNSNFIASLNTVFDAKGYSSRISQIQLHEMVVVMWNLAHSQASESVVKALHAGEEYLKSSVPGFVVQGDHYFLEQSIFMEKSTNGSSLGITSYGYILPPQTSSDPIDHRVWDKFGKDEKKRNHFISLRATLPYLASFRSLNILTKMKSLEPFHEKSLQTSIEANWKSWGQTRFVFHLCIYLVWLVMLTVLHKLTTSAKDKAERAKFVYVLLGSVSLGFARLLFLKGKQVHVLGLVEYMHKGWNLWQSITQLFIFFWIFLEFCTGSSKETVSYFSSTALLLSWLSLIFLLRGFKRCAWIVYALSIIVLEMTPYVTVLGVVILSFSIFFWALGCSFRSVFMTTLYAGFFGSQFESDDNLDLEVDVVEQSAFKNTFETFANIIILLLVAVISMNAMIAFICEILAEISSNKKAILAKVRASFLMDMFSVINPEKRREIETRNKWTYMVVSNDTLKNKDTKADIHEDARKTTKTNLAKHSNSVKSELDDIKKRQEEMESKLIEVTVNQEKMESKLVNMRDLMEVKLENMDSNLGKMKDEMEIKLAKMDSNLDVKFSAMKTEIVNEMMLLMMDEFSNENSAFTFLPKSDLTTKVEFREMKSEINEGFAAITELIKESSKA